MLLLLILLPRNEIAIVQPRSTGGPEQVRIDVSSTNHGKASGKLSCARVLSSVLPVPIRGETHQPSLLPQNQLL